MPWKIKLNYSLLADNPGGGDCLDVPGRTDFKGTRLAERPGVWSQFLCRLFISWGGGGKSRRLSTLESLGQCDFLMGKLEN